MHRAQTISKSTLLLLGGIVISLFALVYVFVNPDALMLHRLESMRVAGIGYDSRPVMPIPYEIEGKSDSRDDGLELDPETGLVRNLKARSLHISMIFNARSLGGHPNIFQTATYNAGVRLEISRNVLALIVGSHSATGFDVLFVSNDLRSGVDHALDLLIDRNNRVILKFDGDTITDTLFPELDYKITDIVIGSGFSKMRRFDGRISNASVEYAIYRINPNAAALSVDLKAFLFTITLSCGYFLVRPERRFGIRWPWLSPPSWRWQSPSSINPPSSNPLEEPARRYVWPLPGDAIAELTFERRQLSFRALAQLAKELEISAGRRTSRTTTGADSFVENTWRLPNDVVATVRTSSSERTALRRLAEHIRELAGCVEQEG